MFDRSSRSEVSRRGGSEQLLSAGAPLTGASARCFSERKSGIEIVGIATTGRPESRASIPEGVHLLLASPSELAALRPRSCGRSCWTGAIEAWAEPALAAAPAMIITSTNAFCDDYLRARLAALADHHRSRILIPSGAIGAVDALASAAVLGLDHVTHQIIKPPIAWKGTPADKLLKLSELSDRTTFFFGSAGEAAFGYPQNANATVVTALAGIGLDNLGRDDCRPRGSH